MKSLLPGRSTAIGSNPPFIDGNGIICSSRSGASVYFREWNSRLRFLPSFNGRSILILKNRGGAAMDGIEKNYFQSLYHLAATLNSARSSDEILNSIVEGVAKAMGAKACSLMLLTPDKQVLYRISAYGLSDWYLRIGPVQTDKSMSNTLNGKTVAVLDAPNDSRVHFRKQVEQEGIASILSVPVKLREEVIGVMRVYSSNPRQFTDADSLFASVAANFGAIALESANFYHTLQKDYDDFREELLQRHAYLGNEWDVEGSIVTLPQDELSPLPPSR
jgi:GAF domain-containing protein